MNLIKPKKALIGLLLALIFGLLKVNAQNEPKPGVKVIACVKQDQVILRWSATTAVTWQYANEYGYTIEKYAFIKDGKTLAKPQRQILTAAPLKPKPQEAWKTLVIEKKNQYAGIAAQAIFGKTFQMDETIS